MTKVMNDTKQKWFWYLFDHWRAKAPEISFQWELNLALNAEFSKRRGSISLSVALNGYRPIFWSSTEIQKVPGPPRCPRISWSTTILRMKISPCSRRFGHVQCQESYLLGLILGFIYKLPRKVYFDSCTFSLLASPLIQIWDYHNVSTFFAVHVERPHVSLYIT